MRRFFFTVSITLYCYQSFAENPRSAAVKYPPVQCPTIDLTDKPPLSERKQLAQGDSAWCCSYALTDALSLKYGKNFSPINIAIAHARDQNRLDYCRSMSDVINAVNASSGICYEDQVTPYSSAGMSALINLWNATVVDPMWSSAYCQSRASFNVPIFKNITNIKDLISVVTANDGKSFFDFLDKLEQKNCSAHQQVHLQYRNIGTTRESINEIFGALNSGTSPIVSVTTKRLFEFGGNQNLLHKIAAVVAGDHMVNIVGARALNGKCYLKVRDSLFGGSACRNGGAKPGVLCAFDSKDNGTYELEIDAFVKAARAGIVVK